MKKLVFGVLGLVFLVLGVGLIGGWLDPATLEGGSLGFLQGPLQWLTDTAGATVGSIGLIVVGAALLLVATKGGDKDGKRKK